MKKITLLLIAIVTLCFSFSAVAQCDYTLEMNDSFGDGWNGGTIDVLVDGMVVIDEATFTTGAQATISFTVSDGQDVTTVHSLDGNYPGEMSYRVLDALGVGVGTGDPTADITAGTIAVLCPTCSIPAVTYNVVSNCPVDTDFTVEVVVSDIGTASGVTISDDQGTAVSAGLAAGTYSYGAYANATPVVITITNDDDGACNTSSSTLTFANVCPPANDNFVDAIAISAGTTVAGTTLGATIDEDDAPDGTGADLDTANVWYSFTGSGVAEDVTLSTCGVVNTDYDTEALIYTGTSGNLIYVAEGYDECGGSAEGYHFETTFTSDGTSTYWMSMSGYNGAEGNFEIVVSAATLSTDTFENENAFTYFPNPVKNELTLNAQKDIQNVAVYNMLGQEVIRTAPNTVNSTVNMNELSQGAYFVKVTIGNQIKTLRIIKQ
ncbi:MAG: hypothetical protein ACJARX_000110 [Psychroserpens sp.]|jgi:hypothetical protein